MFLKLVLFINKRMRTQFYFVQMYYVQLVIKNKAVLRDDFIVR